MDPILSDFLQDIDRIEKLLKLFISIEQFTEQPTFDILETSEPFLQQANLALENALGSHPSIPIMRGTLLLYLAGRFEEYSRSIFQDLCQRLVVRANSFEKLPKRMQENLILFTGRVIENPRKYGHGERGVRSFIQTLASNFDPTVSFNKINHECLSVTDNNMKPEILAEMFSRVGIVELWKKIGEQASLQALYETGQASSAESKAKQDLSELMDLRNSIAHPSSNITWPSKERIDEFIQLLKVLSNILADLVCVYETSLCRT